MLAYITIWHWCSYLCLYDQAQIVIIEIWLHEMIISRKHSWRKTQTASWLVFYSILVTHKHTHTNTQKKMPVWIQSHSCIHTAGTAACTVNQFCCYDLFILRPVDHVRCISAWKGITLYMTLEGICWMHNAQLRDIWCLVCVGICFWKVTHKLFATNT